MKTKLKFEFQKSCRLHIAFAGFSIFFGQTQLSEGATEDLTQIANAVRSDFVAREVPLMKRLEGDDRTDPTFKKWYKDKNWSDLAQPQLSKEKCKIDNHTTMVEIELPARHIYKDIKNSGFFCSRHKHYWVLREHGGFLGSVKSWLGPFSVDLK